MKANQFKGLTSCRFNVYIGLAVFGGSLGFSLTTLSAWADDPENPADISAARDLAIEGLKLADAENCKQAIDKLSRAEKLHHSPIVLSRLGECRIKQGKILDGTEDLQRLLHEPLPESPPTNWVRARERAQATLAAAKSKIAYFVISIRGAVRDASVMVDGQPVSSLLLDRERPTDPGDHLIESSAPGFLKDSRHVSIGAGERIEVNLKLQPDPHATDAQATKVVDPWLNKKPAQTPATHPAARANPIAPKSEVKTDSSSGATSGYLLMGVGGVALATSGVVGYLALNDKKHLDDQCPNNACAPTSRGALDVANRTATASTILVASGAGVIALGAIICLASGGSASEEHPPTSVQARAFVGVGQAGIAGTF